MPNKGFIAPDTEVVYYFFSSLSYVNFNKLVILGYQQTDHVYAGERAKCSCF